MENMESSSVEPLPRNRLRLSSAVGLTAISMYAYGLAFCYQAGALTIYQAPLGLISFDLATVLSSIAAMGLFFLIAFVVLGAVPFSIRSVLPGIGIIFLQLAFGAGTAYGIYRALHPHKGDVPTPWFAWVGTFLYDFVVAYMAVASWKRSDTIADWFKGNWKPRKSARPPQQAVRPSDDTAVLRMLRYAADCGAHPALLGFLFIVMPLTLVVAFSTSQDAAAHPKRLLTSRKDSTTVLLDVLGERALVGSVSKDGDTLFNSYRIASSSELSSTEWFVRPIHLRVYLRSK